MKILVLGGGGREHALVWKLRQSPSVEKIWCAPGNGGIACDAECHPAELTSVPAMVQLAQRLKPDLTVVGPEVPVVLGVADEFASHGLRVLAPSRAAARLEGSKIFAKEFLRRHGIPTAALYGVYDSPGDAYSALCAVDWPVVIKADGLCGGKGVLVAESPDDATAFIERLMEKREFGNAGSRILLEEALLGEELSYIVLTDGEQIFPLAPTRDHKRAFDGDMGPNTGGMGAYCTDELADRMTEQLILEQIVEPTVEGMASEGTPYQGFLYFGLMLTAGGPKVLEFNCRMGDPEAQPLVVRMNLDLAELLCGVAQGKLPAPTEAWRPGASVCVVLSSGGYPGQYETGKEIHGLTEAKAMKNVTIFHAGTRHVDTSYYSSSGRVLGVTAIGDQLEEAVRTCYEGAAKIRFDGMHYRRDIGGPGVGAGRRAAG
jgi:phosphoribosylamine---glycine ligase